MRSSGFARCPVPSGHSVRSRSGAGLFVNEMTDAGAEVVIARIYGQNRRQPEGREAGKGGPGKNGFAGWACQEKGDGEELHGRFPLGQPRDRNTDPQFGQKLPQAGNEDFAAQDDDGELINPLGGRRIFVLSLQGDTLQVYTHRVEGQFFDEVLCCFDGTLLVSVLDNARKVVGVAAMDGV